MVPHKEIQWNNGTPQEKFYSLATFGHNREDNQVPHKCHVYGFVCGCVCSSAHKKQKTNNKSKQ